jgi:hypothetical protein
MERTSQIWKHLKGATPEEEDRRGAILDGLFRSFNEGGDAAAKIYLDGQMTELQGDFDKALRNLQALL